MKTTHIYSVLALAAGALAINQSAKAQDVVYSDEAVSVTEFTCDPKTHYSSNWRENWFIQVGAGINQPFVERTLSGRVPGHSVDRKKMTATYNFGFGRWFSPYLGFRINALGGALHWDTPTKEQPNNGWSRGKHVNLNAELMWDMFNTFGGVNSDRVFSIIPFVGIGGDYMWDMRDASGVNVPAATNIHRTHSDYGYKNSSWTLPVTAGLQFRLRLCEYVDFFAEARASFYGDNWNNVAYGDPVEANVAVLGGFNFNIGGRNWKEYNECASLSQIASLNNEVNLLRSQVLTANQTIASLESQLPCPEPKVITKNCVNAPLMTTVRFTIDSAVISPEEEVNVYNMAQWLKDNPKENITIVGFADKDTGSSEYNMQLSKERAEAVCNQLVEKYGIAKDRLTVRYDGSDVQPYDVNNWNRIVIFTQPQ
ncbi:MAG: OmpA family protein [Muribaculaceae bacterium]|nr:OmpA family protein [Muribaculaceae bacterium]